MDKKNIQSILWDVLEDEIPSETIKLWPAVKADLVAGQQQGEKMNITRERRISQVAFGSLVIIALLTAVLLTPPGRAFAQDLFNLCPWDTAWRTTEIYCIGPSGKKKA